MSKRSAQRARGRARWEQRKAARRRAIRGESAGWTFIGKPYFVRIISDAEYRAMRASGLARRPPPSLRGKRRRTRRYRERQL